MERVGIPPADRDAIFRTVAAILNLGNIFFAPGPEDSSVVDAGAEQYLQATGRACRRRGHDGEVVQLLPLGSYYAFRSAAVCMYSD